MVEPGMADASVDVTDARNDPAFETPGQMICLSY
jgi:hypothetical protein